MKHCQREKTEQPEKTGVGEGKFWSQHGFHSLLLDAGNMRSRIFFGHQQLCNLSSALLTSTASAR